MKYEFLISFYYFYIPISRLLGGINYSSCSVLVSFLVCLLAVVKTSVCFSNLIRFPAMITFSLLSFF